MIYYGIFICNKFENIKTFVERIKIPSKWCITSSYLPFKNFWAITVTWTGIKKGMKLFDFSASFDNLKLKVFPDIF